MRHDDQSERAALEQIPIWEQLPNEPRQAFAAFCAYRNMGAKRSVDGAYRKTYPDRHFTRAYWHRWVAPYRWVERANAYDLHLRTIEQRAAEEALSADLTRLAANQRAFRENEVYLADQGFRMVRQILSLPIITDEYVQKDAGKTIIHKRVMIAPAMMVAAATLMKVSSDIGRKGLGLKDEAGDTITPEQFKEAFYKTTGRMARELPAGALPPMPAQTAVKPEFELPGDGTATDASHNQPANGTPANGNAITVVPPRERP